MHGVDDGRWNGRLYTALCHDDTVIVLAVGAIRYKWMKNGTEISGGEDGELTVAWAKGGATDAYTVTPVYDVFETETYGVAIPFTIENRPQGTIISIK